MDSTLKQASEDEKRNKDFLVLFELKDGQTNKESLNLSWFDTKKEAIEEIQLIEEIYKDVPKIEWWDKLKLGMQDWVYLLIDFKKKCIIRSGSNCERNSIGYNREIISKYTNGLRLLDIFKRSPEDTERLKNYKWDIGEYEGWLRFRYGDGQNDIKLGIPTSLSATKKKPTKPNSPFIGKKEEDIDFIEEEFDKMLEKETIERSKNRW